MHGAREHWAEVRLVDAEEALHRSGREAELVAGDHLPIGDESFHEQLLNGVAVLHAQVRHVLGEWVDGCSSATSLIQGVGEILRLLPV